MTVNILYGNLPTHLWETISDSVRFITGGLEECGVAVKTGVNQIDRDSVNLFLDRFYMEPNFPLQLKTGGVRYGLICTEVIAPDGTWNYGAEAEDPATVTAFDLAAKYADFVWCLLEESVEACKAINPNSAYLPYGYLPEMETVNRQPNDHRDTDVRYSVGAKTAVGGRNHCTGARGVLSGATDSSASSRFLDGAEPYQFVPAEIHSTQNHIGDPDLPFGDQPVTGAARI